MKDKTATIFGDITMKLYKIAKEDEDYKDFATKMMGKISSKINSERDKN